MIRFTTAARLFASAAVCLPLLTATQARAQDARTTTRVVSIADLDLRSADGAARLRHRLEVAASQVCGEPESMGSPDFDSYQRCIDGARRNAAGKADMLVAAARSNRDYAAAVPPR